MSETISPNTKLAHYAVISKLGAGGMGEVYLAQDTKLDRKVALKILPADVASNRDRMDRFVREAKSAAALNHPNIAHVYEIGESEGVHFIAMEFVDGYTLRTLIHAKKTELPKLLRYLQHAAEGLAKAHAAGIVHRDLKPDNIMVTVERHAKILDFGLAKLIEPQSHSSQKAEGQAETEIATAILQHHSTPGTILGTVGYMSPEQAQGKIEEIDHRTDIFSFGCILYEAITGQKAFEGKDTIDSLNKIIREPVPPIGTFNATAPADLQRIVRRCLAKDPEERYQTIKDVAIEIKDVRRELANAPVIGTTVPLPSVTTHASGEAVATHTTTALSSLSPLSHASSAEYPSPPPGSNSLTGGEKRRSLGILFVALGAVTVIVAGFVVYQWASSSRVPFAVKAPKVARLTNSGRVLQAAISRDGRYVAYVQTDDANRQSIWMRQVAAASDAKIVPEHEGASYAGLTFSPDGEFVYYARFNGGDRALWRTPILGGGAKKLNIEIGSQLISLSPDGKQVAFARLNRNEEQSIVIANLDGSGERAVTTKKSPFFNGPGPVWSPDGRTLLIGDEVGSAARRVVSIKIDDGSHSPFSERVWAGNRAPWLAWLSDGNGVLVTAAEEAGTNAQIWFLGVGDKEGQQVTSDLSEYTSLSLTWNSGTICSVRTETTVNLWVADVSDIDNPRQITSGSERNDGNRGLTWSPDGKVYYYSDAGSGQNIWVTAADGSGAKQLTAQARRNRDADISADGRHIVWESNRGDGNTIWRMDIDGGNPKQLTTGGPHYFPKFSPDGKWVLFTSLGSADPESNSLWRVPFEGGEATPIPGTKNAGRAYGVTRDGTRIYFTQGGQGAGGRRLMIIPFEGGEPIARIDVPERSSLFTLAPDGRNITFIREVDGQDNIWSQPLEGGSPRQLTHYQSLEIRSFAWSRDGKKIVLSRGSRASDAVLIKDFR